MKQMLIEIMKAYDRYNQNAFYQNMANLIVINNNSAVIDWKINAI